MNANWTETLAEFLRNEPGVGAVRLDAGARRVQLATLGQVDVERLRVRLDATLATIAAELESDAAAPTGFTLTREGGVVQLSGPGCETAPKLWRWKEYAWPASERDELEDAHKEDDWRELATFASTCGGLGLAGWACTAFGLGPAWLATALFAAALVAGGWDAAIDSWANLRRGRLDIHFLMLAVAVGAAAIGAWSEAVLLLFLFSASGAMEAFANERTHREVDALLKTAPKQATLVVEEVGVGDLVRVRPGEAFCADGVVEAGESGADESALSGEAAPVDKAKGDPVYSGTINLGGTLDWRVARLPSESTLQKIIRLIHGAQKMRAPSQRFTDKFGTFYTYVVLGVSAAMFLVWWRGLGIEPWHGTPEAPSAFYRAMTLLVVMSPCALVLSIPSAILAAIAWGARRGVLFRGGAALEKLAGVNVIALDKTGTLTTGEMVVEAYESFPPGRENEVMELALALEARSEHPLARAIVRDARARGVAERVIEGFESLTGQGVRGRLGDAPVMLGRRELLQKGPLKGWAEGLPNAAAEFSEVWVVGPGYLGRVLLKDAIRRESAPVLEKLRRAGLRTVMLTGDRRATAEAVGAELGLDEVRAGLSPAQKVESVTALKAGGRRRVAMVGDGVNDAPSLAAANVAIAMGARGSDAALEQAEIVLMNDRIEGVFTAFDLSRRARAVIRQNLIIALGVVACMALATIFGRVPLALGVTAHEGSTVLVCLNSLRLLFAKGG
ncbi:cation-translocating P-type ATPase [bacterium]|nr:cation-translocating P-type ATPase [bacterium]